jgi:hypothetical protein
METKEFERFRFGFFEERQSARNGLAKVALSQLEGAERIVAENMLIEYLPDSRAIDGLAVLRSRRALPRLLEIFEAECAAQRGGDRDRSPCDLIRLAKALWQIAPGDRRFVVAITDALASADNPLHRIRAAQELFGVHDGAAARALDSALDDGEKLVRHQAARALFAMHGLPTDKEHYLTAMYRMMSTDATVRQDAKREILAAIRAQPPAGAAEARNASTTAPFDRAART